MHATNRSGFALPIAIGSIVVIGTIITGVFFTATQENRLGRNTMTQERALRSAEGALNYAYGNWNSAALSAISIGSTTTQVFDSSRKGWVDTVRITRLNSSSYWMSSTSYAGTAEAARHRTGLVVHLMYPKFNFLGALTARGPMTIGGSSYINGNDSTPAGWTECPPQGVDLPGIATSNRGNITFNACSHTSCVDGNPDIKVTSAASDTNSYFVYGNNVNWQTLTSQASQMYVGSQTFSGLGPVVSNGACMAGDPMNWGDPNRARPTPGPCESDFPIIYFSDPSATVHLTTGVGQGILLVDGDLIVDGGFQFFGVVIVRGHLTTQGTGGHFNGAVMAADVNLEQNTVLGDALIQYSSCAINEALLGTAVARRIPQRSWAYVF